MDDKALLEIGDRLRTQLASSAVQLLSAEGPRPRPVGSGVIVRLEEHLYILTAAHVVKDLEGSPIWIGPNAREYRKVAKLEGLLFEDPLDAAIFPLPSSFGRWDGAYGLPIHSTPALRPAEPVQEHFLLLGYPANRTNVHHPSGVTVTLISVLSIELPDIYANFQLDRRHHLALRRRQNWTTENGPRGAPSLAAASGSGLWCFDSNLTYPPRLAAIFTSVPRAAGGERPIMVGTRIEAHLELLRRLSKWGGKEDGEK